MFMVVIYIIVFGGIDLIIPIILLGTIVMVTIGVMDTVTTIIGALPLIMDPIIRTGIDHIAIMDIRIIAEIIIAIITAVGLWHTIPGEEVT